MLVSGLRGYHIIDVACGSGDAHSMAVADDGKFIVYLPTYRQRNVKRLDAPGAEMGKEVETFICSFTNIRELTAVLFSKVVKKVTGVGCDAKLWGRFRAL